MTPELGWNEYGYACKTGQSIDQYLGRGDLQDAENCGYAPTSVLAELGVETLFGDPQAQFRNGRIVLLDGTVLDRGGALGCVWAVVKLGVGPRCTLSPDCEYDASHWPETPCGRTAVECPDCGMPLPREGDGPGFRECPHGWRAVTIADIKQFAAEEGFDTVLTINEAGEEPRE